MFKKAIFTTQSLTVLLASAALLIGCSKGGNVPKDWDKDGVGSSLKKLQCASEHKFSAKKVNDFRADKLTKMQALNVNDKTGGQNNNLLVIRTTLNGLPNFDGNISNIPEQLLISMASQKNSNAELQAANEFIVAEVVDCQAAGGPTAKFEGFGFTINGKLESISEKSIELVGTDPSGVITTVKVEKTTVSRKKDPAGFQKAQERENNGFMEMTVTIGRKFNNADLVGAIIKQKTTMNVDEEIEISKEVANLIYKNVGPEQLSPMFAEKMNSFKAQSTDLKDFAATGSIKVSFSSFIQDKRTLIEMMNFETVDVKSNKVPVVVIDGVVTAVQPTPAAPASPAQTAPAAQPVPAAPPTAQQIPVDPSTAQYPIINPDLSKDSFLLNYLKDIVGTVQQEEAADDAAAEEAADAADADAAAEAADEVATPEEAKTNGKQETPAPEAQKTKVPVTATGKIISV